MNLYERYERDKEMGTDLKIRALRIHNLERQMEHRMDPFGKEFEQAADQLRRLRKEQREAAAARMKYRQETQRLEAQGDYGKREREAKEAAESCRRKLPPGSDGG